MIRVVSLIFALFSLFCYAAEKQGVLHLSVESKKGLAVPSGDVYLSPGSDTLVYAIPYGGYVFDSWTKVTGSVKISDPKNATTRVKPESDFCSIRANYVLDSAAEPDVSITNLDLSNHPGICAHVSVVDKRNGLPIVGLEPSDFELFQDGASITPQVTTIQNVSGISVALVVDESGSMEENSRMEKAKDAIRRFVNEMGPYDRTAIVGFMGDSLAKVHQTMTSDKRLLLQSVDSLKAGGNTNIRTGTLLGVQQLIGEVNTTAVIVFSDGDNGKEKVTTSDVTYLANRLNTTIYSIAVESSNLSPLTELAEGTGGSFSYAKNASELTSIYMAIRGTVQERYVLCFRSPDTVLDGDTHTVAVKTDFLHKSAVDSVFWNEDFMPPDVKLTEATWDLVGVEQKADQSLEISVYVNTKDSLESVTLYMRGSSLSIMDFRKYEMTHIKDSLWTFVVPESLVTYPGFDFYVFATSAQGLIGGTPSVPSPFKQPYSIPVENKVPVVEMDSLKCIDIKRRDGKMRFTITDEDGVHDATLYYRDSSSVLFDEITMTQKGDVWEALVPGGAFASGIGEIYVRAVDGVGSSVRWPKRENVWIPVCGRLVYVPEVKDSIAIVNKDTSKAPVGRTTEVIGLTLKTEDFTEVDDSVYVKLSCLASGDVESEILLVEKRSGLYENFDKLSKDERTPEKDDGKISCASLDTMVVEYEDPLFKTFARDTVYIKDSVSYSYRFMETDKDEDLDSVQTGVAADFRIRVTAFSESIHEVDTLKLLLLTDKDDSLWVKAVETGEYTSTFEYQGVFRFVEEESELDRSELDGVFDFHKTINRVKIQPWIKGDKSSMSKRDSLIVFSNYIPVEYAEIYDLDLDGKADSVRIKFIDPLKDDLEGIDTLYWNKAGGTWRSVSKNRFKAVQNRLWFEAQLKSPFEYGVTAADVGKAPYLKLKGAKGVFSQKIKVKDKIGAVPVEAVKHPGIISLGRYLKNVEEVPPDTLVVTMSEKIKNKGKDDAWKNLFVYASSCEDTVNQALIVDDVIKKDSLGIVWNLVLKKHFLKTGDCIRTNPKASYVDAEGNSMGRGGVEVMGGNGESYLYEVAPAPAVSGGRQKTKWIAPGEDEWSRLPDSLAAIRVASIMPYKASVIIYDGLSSAVTSFTQEFGENGEMTQELRGNGENCAKTGFLTWNKRSSSGRLVGSGIYIWRIDFKFKDGHSEQRLVKMGVKRKK